MTAMLAILTVIVGLWAYQSPVARCRCPVPSCEDGILFDPDMSPLPCPVCAEGPARFAYFATDHTDGDAAELDDWAWEEAIDRYDSRVLALADDALAWHIAEAMGR